MSPSNPSNPSRYGERGRGYRRASFLRSTQHQTRHSTSASGHRHYFPRGAERGYRQRPLSQRSPQRYLQQARAPEQDDISKAFRLLRTNPGRALAAAEVLLDRNSVPPSRCVPIYQLKARALFQLEKIDDCIAFINSLETRVRNDKGLLMAKARALQARGCFNEALPLFQHLYARHQVAYKDHKTQGLALGRLLQLMGGKDNLEKALAIYTRLRSRAAGERQDTHCNDKQIELALGYLFQLMGGTENLEKALAIFTQLRTRMAGGRDISCGDKDVELALGRHLQLMGGSDNLQQALDIFTQLRTRMAAGRDTSCGDKDVELTLGRHLQLMGGRDNLQQALTIFTRLRTRAAGGQADTPCHDKDIELALGRLFQLIGGADNLEKALTIFTRLRTWRAGGRRDTPCDDKEIELTLGRLLQFMGGADNLEKALAIFTQLRTWRAAGRKNTPCDDREIELTLGIHLQLMGATGSLQQALDIFTRLRTRAAAGRANTPCDDKEIELALSRHLQLIGGPDYLDQALAIYTRLRTRAAAGRANSPCDDKDIELALAALYVERRNWPEFDALQLQARRFPGFEPHLHLSIRYFSELLETLNMPHGQSRLLGKAMRSAVLAMEESGFMNASCISQLAHCLRLLSCWPDSLLKERGIQHKDVKRLSLAAKFLFDTADMLAPYRRQMDKDQHWRARERALLALLT